MPLFIHRLFQSTPLQAKLVLLICLIFVPPIILFNIHVHYFIDSEYRTVAGAQAMNVARETADLPLVKAFMQGDRTLLPQVDAMLETLCRVGDVRFIVLVGMDGLRAYHPVHQNIGKPMVGGDGGEAFLGKSYISLARGTFGFSLRAFTPIYGEDGAQTGFVVVGKLSDAIEKAIARFAGPIWPGIMLLLFFGVLLAARFSHSIINILHGLEPEEIARRLEERIATLQTVREGIIAVDTEGRITLVNKEAKRILQVAGIQGECVGQPVHDVIPNTRLDEVLRSGQPQYDDEQHINGVVVLTNRTPILVGGRLAGAISTFRDMTEIRQLAEKLTGVHRYVDALRSQSHEFLNKLHVLYGLARNGCFDDLTAYLAQLTGMKREEEEAVNLGVKDPVIAGFLSSKFSRSRELGMTLRFRHEGILPEVPDPRARNCYITILGNLIDNGLEAMEESAEKVLEVSITVGGAFVALAVRDTGCGLEPAQADAIFARGYSTKGEGRGYGLYLTLLAVDDLGGTLELTSPPGGGAMVTVRLPLPDSHEEE